VHEGTTPTTLTSAEQVDLFPQTSFTVSVTALLPILEQLKDVFDSEAVTVPPQLSKERLFTSAGTIVATPLARVTDIFLHTAAGAVWSLPLFV
jgi:hypothetical protein